MKGPIILILILTTISIKGKTNTWKMDEDSDTDTELGALGPFDYDYASGGLSEYEEVADTWDEFYPPPTLSPPHTIDISGVRHPPASLMTSADVVSARRLPPLPLEVADRGNFIVVLEVGFDTCVNGERGKKRENNEMTYSEIEREINELRKKVKDLTKTGGAEKEGQRQGVKWSDQGAQRTSSTNQEDGGMSQGELRTGSEMRKVSSSTGRSLTSEGQGETRRRKELVAKSEPMGARPKSKLISASNSV